MSGGEPAPDVLSPGSIWADPAEDKSEDEVFDWMAFV
jgi:hypothetical protein